VGVSGQKSRPSDPVLGQVYRIIGLQVLVTALISLPLFAIHGALIAVSAFAGGAIGFTTSWVYARRMIAASRRSGRGAGVDDPRALLRNHFAAELLKLGLVVVLFAAVFTFLPGVATLPLLLTFMATLAVYWVALLFVF
jgi:ATP synthase protein I